MDVTELERVLPSALPRLRALASRLVGHPADAEDVVQEAMLRAARSVSEFRGDARLETWLFTITTRAALDHLRENKRFRTQVMIDACSERGAEAVGGIFADASVAFDVHEHVAFCFGCVGRSLEPEVAAALVLREVFGLANDECARIAGTSEPVHRHRLREARASMEREFEGLCALVRKDGPCHQCSTLRSAAPPERRGPALPIFPLPLDARIEMVRGARTEGTAYAALRDHFHDVSRAMNEAE